MATQVPPEAWDSVPTDGSSRVDFYLRQLTLDSMGRARISFVMSRVVIRKLIADGWVEINCSKRHLTLSKAHKFCHVPLQTRTYLSLRTVLRLEQIAGIPLR